MIEDMFPIRYGFWKRLLVVMGMGPARSRVKVDPTTVQVRMGWAFRAEIDRRSIVGAKSDSNKYAGIGVHGWRGSWLVNGSVSGIVTVSIDPPAPARVVGFPVRLRTLYVSLEDPAGFLARLNM
jgi:hypothetical protein